MELRKRTVLGYESHRLRDGGQEEVVFWVRVRVSEAVMIVDGCGTGRERFACFEAGVAAGNNLRLRALGASAILDRNGGGCEVSTAESS